MVKKKTKQIKKVSKQSLNLTEENLGKLRKLFPSVFSEGKIDFEKLKIFLGQEIDEKIEKYNFTWAGKSEAFKNIQTTAKGTLIPDEKDSVDFDKTENLFIEGDNLEVLKLLQKSYQNKIKMIYIDPPYNTGKDFVYKDNFKDSIGNYEKITGQVDEEGNRTDTNKETNGRFHSDWLTMMYPRLYLAKNLLKDDGVIFVSIDDHEVHNLRKIMDDIFGEENFVAQFIWKSRSSLQYSEPLVSSQTEYVLLYSKNKGMYGQDKMFNKIKKMTDELTYSNPDDDPNGKWTSSGLIRDDGRKEYEIVTPSGKKYVEPWLYSKENMELFRKQGILWFGINGNAKPRKKSYWKDYKGKTSSTLLENEFIYFEDGKEGYKKKKLFDIGTTESGSKELKEILGTKKSILDYPKPSTLIRYLIGLCVNDRELVLDFFAGSGTTAQAIFELNKMDKIRRNFILVQLPEVIPRDKKTKHTINFLNEIKKPLNIAEISKERIRRVIKKIKEGDKEKAKKMDLGFKVFKLFKSNYKIWENYDGENVKELLKQMELFQSPLITGYKKINLIYEVLLKEQGYTLNSEVEEVKGIKSNKVFKISNKDKFFYICLDEKIKKETIKDLKLNKEIMFVCLDDSLEDNQKINLSSTINLRSI